MAVITRNRAEELHTVQLAPRRTSHKTMSHSTGYRVKHYIKAGIPIDNDTSFRHLRHISQQLPGIADSVKNTIIPTVQTVRTHHIRFTGQNIHHPDPNIQLSLRRLTAGHIKIQSLFPDLFKLLLKITFHIL